MNKRQSGHLILIVYYPRVSEASINERNGKDKPKVPEGSGLSKARPTELLLFTPLLPLMPGSSKAGGLSLGTEISLLLGFTKLLIPGIEKPLIPLYHWESFGLYLYRQIYPEPSPFLSLSLSLPFPEVLGWTTYLHLGDFNSVCFSLVLL